MIIRRYYSSDSLSFGPAGSHMLLLIHDPELHLTLTLKFFYRPKNR